MSDQSPRSAVEIALERLRQQDLQDGLAPAALSDQQKAAIAEVRSIYQAKLAYAELMHKFALTNQADPASRATMAEQYQRDRERFNSERDAKIDQIRRGVAPTP